jgi:hypothetical protein
MQHVSWVQNSVDLVDDTVVEGYQLHSLSVVERLRVADETLTVPPQSVDGKTIGQLIEQRRGKGSSQKSAFPLVLVRERRLRLRKLGEGRVVGRPKSALQGQHNSSIETGTTREKVLKWLAA